MESNVTYIQGELYVSTQWLIDHCISIETIRRWPNSIKKGDSFLFEKIPSNTLRKLPSFQEVKALAPNIISSSIYSQVYKEHKKLVAGYIKEIKATVEATPEQINIFARRAGAIEAALDINTSGNGRLMGLFEAFEKMFPGWLKNKNVLNNKLRVARKEGILKAAVDNRLCLSNDNAKRFDDFTKQRAAFYFASPKAYSSNQIRCFLSLEIDKYNLPLPSLRTVKYWMQQFSKNKEMYASRYGSVKAFNAIEPYISTIPALYSNDQWQADGLTLPFYSKGFVRHTLFFVLDAHSRKIVGYWIDGSENTTMIVKAFDDAVSSVNGLPYEIKMDNHSYHRTLEGQNFKADTEKFGVKWTISHNPRHKSLIERTNKRLNEQYFKLHKGYIGQGVKSRDKGGHTAQELLDKYQKSATWLTIDEIKAIVIKCINDYNNTPLKPIGNVSPTQKFSQNEAFNTISIPFESKIKLFIQRTQRKVARGQINIERAGVKYEYQLPAQLFAKCNGDTVNVRYEALDCIYIFNKKDDYLGTIHQKPKVHGALANQTEQDIELYNKHKGRLTGIHVQAKKENEGLTDRGTKAHPSAFEYVNPVNTPKDVLKELEQNYHLKMRGEEMGIDFNKAERGQPVDEFPLQSLKPKEPVKKNPFAQKNHKPSIVKSFSDNDE